MLNPNEIFFFAVLAAIIGFFLIIVIVWVNNKLRPSKPINWREKWVELIGVCFSFPALTIGIITMVNDIKVREINLELERYRHAPEFKVSLLKYQPSKQIMDYRLIIEITNNKPAFGTVVRLKPFLVVEGTETKLDIAKFVEIGPVSFKGDRATHKHILQRITEDKDFASILERKKIELLGAHVRIYFNESAKNMHPLEKSYFVPVSEGSP